MHKMEDSSMHSDLSSNLEIRFSGLAIWEANFYKIPWPNLTLNLSLPIHVFF